MKKSILCLAMMVVLIVLSPSCKTAEFVWNPVGDWTFSVNFGYVGTISETVSLTGTETGGTLTGWEEFNPLATAGTWTKTGDYSLTITIDYLNSPWRNVVNFTATSSEASPNSMTATGTWAEYWNAILLDTYTISFTGIKTTNLQ